MNYNNTIEYEDLVSYGIFGLIDAIDKFEYSRGVKFETYAHLRIRGAIIDYLREIDWIPRSVRQKTKRLRRHIWKWKWKKGGNATDRDVVKNWEFQKMNCKEFKA